MSISKIMLNLLLLLFGRALERPLLFIPYDYEDFRERSGFLYDYQSLLPGPAIHSFSEFMHHLARIVDGKDDFQIQQTHLRQLIHQYTDTHASERIADLLTTICQS